MWAVQFYCGGNTQVRNEKVDNSLGSGVIVGADGVIVTNLARRVEQEGRNSASRWRTAASFPASW